MNPNYLFLLVAIAAEVAATSFMKASEGFTRLAFTVATVVGYCISFYCLSQALKVVPVGVAYAIWSGFGTVLVTFVGWLVFKQRLDAGALIGIGLIIAGVLVMNLASKSVAH